MKRYDLYLNGQWHKPISNDWIDVENPATKEIIAQVPAAKKDDVNLAVQGAKAALNAWRNSPLEERISYVEKMIEYFENHKDEIVDTVIDELGSTLKVTESIHFLQYIDNAKDFVENAKKMPMVDHYDSYDVYKDAVGIVACLTPWNFPFGQIEKKVIPALLMGNTVVLKPSQKAPLTAYYFAKAAHEVGLPQGVLQLVTGRGAEVGDVLAKHPDVNMLSFTGSTKGGKEVALLGIDTMKRLALELGGKSAAIILEGADYDKAVKDALFGVFPNAGQACSSKTRLLAPRKDKGLIEELAIKHAKDYKFGDPRDPQNDYGAIISQQAYKKVMSYIDLGKKEASLLYEGDYPNGDGYFIPPVIFTDVDNKSRIAQEEIFGPVLCIIYYDTVEEAIEIANDSIYGLHGQISGPEEKALEVARQIQAGQIIINDGKRTQNAPFGGYKQSGIGREGGKYGLEEYVELKTIFK
ncbi:MAG: aldehyde dehydrogenase family protein [Tissierellia bacterium]|nr:aldehyde dehydrogenase family protein [Tissierellia bacterium]